MASDLDASLTSPRYERISVDIAKKVSSGIYEPGTKLHGRSTLAGIYRVSPETIRKATAILEEAGVLRVVHGQGMVILSKEAADAYLLKAQTTAKLSNAIDRLRHLIEEHKRLGAEMERTLEEMVGLLKLHSSSDQ